MSTAPILYSTEEFEDPMLDPVEQAIADIAAGRPVVVVDDEDRENEGDLVVAAEKATPEIVAFMMSECRGLICAPMESDELDRLRLPQMVEDNTESMKTAFTVSVDASAAHGVSTGISAADRATTLQLLASGTAEPTDLVRPGHVFPLRARSGGVLVRNGHTEAAVDLARLAGLRPAATLTFRFAAKPSAARSVADLNGSTVATSYEGIVARYLAEQGIDASVVHLDGAVETAIELGVAEVIADVVETGTSLRNAGLEVIGEPIMTSEAVVIRRTGAEAGADDTVESKVGQFLRRLQGVLVARTYVMMDYDCRVEQLEKAVALTPGLESPTVSPLHNEGWVAVRAMVPSKEAQRIMDDLYDLGARAILTTAIHACRL
ncbi:3,4-dihydroxy-2-butanone 4-phosphate synthase [Streptomyces hirsutus]